MKKNEKLKTVKCFRYRQLANFKQETQKKDKVIDIFMFSQKTWRIQKMSWPSESDVIFREIDFVSRMAG